MSSSRQMPGNFKQEHSIHPNLESIATAKLWLAYFSDDSNGIDNRSRRDYRRVWETQHQVKAGGGMSVATSKFPGIPRF
ncbi:hypothetical protein FPANT_4741 [Fusarium pseudoanthophilum]|uniref:Uncharacterized protein n=1 Tax=Fusarium pseudoanthophilum TaxID=48495 RepID=A0A8H5PDT6_9HYPO|nr:hypothetical protein FPANT_4741 [Fusarium pseudoanthophilum]